jgi:predicted RNase H-like HicB family nuclease
MISDYIDAAMRHAEYKHLPEDGIWYAEIPELEGLWASAEREEDIRAELRDALEGWIALGLSLNHPFPVIDGVGLAVELVS